MHLYQEFEYFATFTKGGEEIYAIFKNFTEKKYSVVFIKPGYENVLIEDSTEEKNSQIFMRVYALSKTNKHKKSNQNGCIKFQNGVPDLIRTGGL